jgi:hypothetical protein
MPVDLKTFQQHIDGQVRLPLLVSVSDSGSSAQAELPELAALYSLAILSRFSYKSNEIIMELLPFNISPFISKYLRR